MDHRPVLLSEVVPGAATAAIGAWIRVGSAAEAAGTAGITHLIEHLLLRRCGERGPHDIAELIDSLGGAVDAFTTREVCAVTAHVPAERWREALDLVLDAVLDPRMVDEEVELERRVVGAEFDLIQDSPTEVAAENALAACWGDHPMARPVLGRREVVDKLTRADLERYHKRMFHGGNLLLAAVGPSDLAGELERAVADRPARARHVASLRPLEWHPGVMVEERSGLEQIYVNLVLPALASDSPEILTLGVLHQLLGAGASSRLFRELRDERGLVYEVSSALFSTGAGGVLDITFSAPVRQTAACWDALFDVLGEVAGGNVTDREVELGRQALTAGIVLGAEGPDALLQAMAGEYLARRRRFSAETLRNELAAVTPARVRSLAGEIVRLDRIAGAVCGPRRGIRLPASLARRAA